MTDFAERKKAWAVAMSRCSLSIVSMRLPSRPIRIDAKSVGRHRPGQEEAGLQLAQAAAAHPLGDQAALVLRHRAADLQQQLVVRVLAHRPVEELDLAARGDDLLDQQHLCT